MRCCATLCSKAAVAAACMLAVSALLQIQAVPLDYQDDCSNFDGMDACKGDQTNPDPSVEERRWQTPVRGSPLWVSSYQDYSHIVGWPTVKYDDSDMKSAVVTVNTVCKGDCKLSYSYNGKESKDKTFKVSSSSFKDTLMVVVKDSEGHSLELEPIDFVWTAPTVNQPSNYKDGQKGAIVEMFGWPYADVEKECEMLGKAGYMGVKVFPPSESVFTDSWPQNNELNPWWFLYQPVSYRLHSRMGTRDQLRSMIVTCRKAGVRVYADAVINHMSGSGNDIQDHRNGNGGGCVTWGPKNATDNSAYFTQGFCYKDNDNTKKRPTEEFPSVPYGPLDFHCERVLNSWSDPFDLNYGWLTGLVDLNTERPNVQQRIADYLTDLIGIGFSGVRIDAAKHVSPDDLSAIFAIFKENTGGSLPKDFIAYLEVLIGGEKDLLLCQAGDYNYAASFAQKLKKAGLSDDDVNKIKIWESTYPKEFPECDGWPIPSERYAISNDCHDDQNPGSSSRDMGDQGSVLVIAKDVPKHRGFEVELFTRTDGNWQIRLVLSSYTFAESGAMGFPDGLSDCKNCVGDQCDGCMSMPYSKAHDDSVCGYTCEDQSGKWLDGVYTRVHRDKSIILAMRKWMGLSTSVSNKDIGLPESCKAL